MKNTLLAGLLAWLIITLLTGCSSTDQADRPAAEVAGGSAVAAGEAAEAEYKKLTAAEAKAMIDHQDLIILDVRTEEEFQQGYIEGAILIPDYELERLAAEKLPDKGTTILIYCRSGNRSRIASHLLIKMGYQNVYDFGGIIDWPYGLAKQ